jgi:hypothetical protein
MTNASQYSKGILSEILEFVMGTGLIPADGEVWKTRRRCRLFRFGLSFLFLVRCEDSNEALATGIATICA